MRPEGYYSSGEFARMAHISVRAVRYYDKQNILKPSFVSEAGARYYSHSDFVRLQQIMLFKYLGFSLEDIRELLIEDMDDGVLQRSLGLQQKLIRDRIEQLQMVDQAISDTTKMLRENHQIDWSQMLELIHLTGVENSLKTQYKNSANITARIRLHSLFSLNKQGWFPWIYEQCDIRPGAEVLEIGCGNGKLWLENWDLLPTDVHVVLSDISEGMIRELRREEKLQDGRFSFDSFDCHEIPFPDGQFDCVIANHMLFYCEDMNRVFREVRRVLKPGGALVCGAYGKAHMREISELARQFDQRIILSAENLYERFGKENGADWLRPHFDSVEWRAYEDRLIVDQPEPLIEYILSCHGNQNQFILEKYNKFRQFVEGKLRKPLEITKDAGVFVAMKKNSFKK